MENKKLYLIGIVGYGDRNNKPQEDGHHFIISKDSILNSKLKLI